MKIAPFFAIVMALLAFTPAQGQNVNTLLENAPQTHPRLFLPAGQEDALQAKIASDPLLSITRDHIIALADKMIPLPPLTYEKEGRRLLSVSRACLRRMAYLGLAYRLTGDKAYAERAEAEMLAVSAFPDWNPSHFLDTAEMTAALAIGYDWCYDALSPEARQTIRQAIIEKGLNASLAGEQWWITNDNNWNQVCHAGMVMGALAIYEDEPELSAQMIQRAVDNIHHSMDQYQPDGAYPEGPMYWSYGTTFNVLLIDALQSVLGSDFGMAQAPGFTESATYFQQASGPSGDYFNYQDCSTRSGVSPAMFWFAAHSEDPSLLWSERSKLENYLSKDHNPDGASSREFPLLLIWAHPMADIPTPDQLHWTGGGEAPVGLHRTSWTDPKARFLGLKGGSPSAGHGHMDVGTFVVEANGVRWAIDLGMQGYHSLESKGVKLWSEDRWKVFRLNNYSHGVLTVNGQLQEVKGNSPIIAHRDTGAMPHTILDTSAAYAGQLASAKRGAGMHEDGYFVIQDEIQAPDQPASVRWGMVTRADVALDGAQATLTQDGEQMTLQVLSPANAKLELIDFENPPHDYDERNPGVHMIAFTTELPANTAETLTIVLTPVPAPAKPEITALKDW